MIILIFQSYLFSLISQSLKFDLIKYKFFIKTFTNQFAVSFQDVTFLGKVKLDIDNFSFSNIFLFLSFKLLI